MAILGILLCNGLNCLAPWVARQQTETLARSLIHDLHYAHQQAQSCERVVIVCPSDDLKHCQELAHRYYMLAYLQNDQYTLVKSYPLQNMTLSIKAGLNRAYILFKPDGTCPFQGSLQIQSRFHQAHLVITHSGRTHLEYLPS